MLFPNFQIVFLLAIYLALRLYNRHSNGLLATSRYYPGVLDSQKRYFLDCDMVPLLASIRSSVHFIQTLRMAAQFHLESQIFEDNRLLIADGTDLNCFYIRRNIVTLKSITSCNCTNQVYHLS